MTIKRLDADQIVCDCTGNTFDTYQDKFLVGISSRENEVVIQLFCARPDCKASKTVTVRCGLFLEGIVSVISREKKKLRGNEHE